MSLPVGSHPGNTGGKPGRSGRPASVVRELCAASFEARIPILEKIADGEALVRIRTPDGGETQTLISASVADRLKAIDMLGKYGGIEKITVETEGGPQQTGWSLETTEERALMVLDAIAGLKAAERQLKAGPTGG